MYRYHIISQNDNVATALDNLKAGESIGGVTLKEDIPVNFKFALEDIPEGGAVIKYSNPIGSASADIKKGALVHTHNVKTKLNTALNYDVKIQERAAACENAALTFKGFRRKNGGAGVRNDIFIIPAVGCVNSLCDTIAAEAAKKSGYADIYALKHPYGCSQLGGDHVNTQRILSGLAKHPNAGGVLIVALGCENNTLDEFKGFLGGYDAERIRFITAQDSGDETAEGVSAVCDLARLCALDKRTNINVSELVIGLKCGGSDALSGITANPLTGMISDRITDACGTALLTEVPEMFGAEHILMARSASAEISKQIADTVNNFKNYYIAHGEPVGENPSPGNKAGGITTNEEKSLGCIQKGGGAAVTQVIEYGFAAGEKGLVVLNCPGNDIVAQTALAAAGAHIILFTTGRGTPLGAPVPTVKISTNTALYQKKKNWIDFDAGVLVTGTDKNAAANALFALIIDVANGQKTRNEINGYRDIAIWKTGVTL